MQLTFGYNKINITETKESSNLKRFHIPIILNNRFPKGGKVKPVKLVSLFSIFVEKVYVVPTFETRTVCIKIIHKSNTILILKNCQKLPKGFTSFFDLTRIFRSDRCF